MITNSIRRNSQKPTRLFKMYAVQLVVRFLLFAYAVLLFVTDPEQLNPATFFSLSNGVTFIDVTFVFMFADALTKFFPFAKIAAGSIKQFQDSYQQATIAIRDSKKQLLTYVQSIKEKDFTLFTEVRDVIVNDIKSRRIREIVPVVVFWIVANAAIAIVLYMSGWLTPQVAVLWSLFYFLFDMVCVVLWCPIQLLFMKNRCCTTCQIFNWDAIMAATPLVFAPSIFSFIILAMALAILAKWEISFALHPERFDERTNDSLTCANCKDKLCQIRNPIMSNMPQSVSSLLPDELLERLEQYVESDVPTTDENTEQKERAPKSH